MVPIRHPSLQKLHVAVRSKWVNSDISLLLPPLVFTAALSQLPVQGPPHHLLCKANGGMKDQG